MPDLTDKNYFMEFLGSFANRVLYDHGFPEGISHSSSLQVIQLHQKLVESFERLSINTAKKSVLEISRPLVFRKSQFSTGPDNLVFGGGQFFGQQPADGKFKEGAVFVYGGLEKRSGRYYVGIDDSVIDVGQVMTNSLINPSLTMIRGIDFIFSDGVIAFKEDPFADGRIAKRSVYVEGSSEGEDELVLWVHDVQVDNGEFSDQFGFVIDGIDSRTPAYHDGIRACLNIISGGPTLSLVDHLVAALVGLPFIKEPQETVLEMTSFGSSNVLVTDLNIYIFDSSLNFRDEVVKGAVLEAGHPITDSSMVYDRNVKSRWWTELDGMVLSEAFFGLTLSSALGFPNRVVSVELGEPEKSEGLSEWRSARFFIAGKPGDVEKFWSRARLSGLAEKRPIGNVLYETYGVTNDDGVADFSKTLMINPLEFLADKILGDSVVIVRIKTSAFTRLEILFRGINLMKEAMPPHLGIIVILEVSFEEDVFFQRQDGLGVEPETVEAADSRDIYFGNSASFPDDVAGLWNGVDEDGEPLTLVPEALSIDLSPDIFREILSFESSSENEDAYGEPLAICQEFIEATTVPICKP